MNVGVGVGVSVLLDELLVPDVGVEVAELLLLEELLEVAVAAGVEVAELELLLEELEEPPVTGRPAPATLLELLLKPMATSLSRRPRISCSHLAKSDTVPWPATIDSACRRAKAY